jgi:hypothetical protein
MRLTRYGPKSTTPGVNCDHIDFSSRSAAARVQSAGELVTKIDLMDRVWPDAIVEDNTLQFHISAICKALGTAACSRIFRVTFGSSSWSPYLIPLWCHPP